MWESIGFPNRRPGSQVRKTSPGAPGSAYLTATLKTMYMLQRRPKTQRRETDEVMPGFLHVITHLHPLAYVGLFGVFALSAANLGYRRLRLGAPGPPVKDRVPSAVATSWERPLVVRKGAGVQSRQIEPPLDPEASPRTATNDETRATTQVAGVHTCSCADCFPWEAPAEVGHRTDARRFNGGDGLAIPEILQAWAHHAAERDGVQCLDWDACVLTCVFSGLDIGRLRDPQSRPAPDRKGGMTMAARKKTTKKSSEERVSSTPTKTELPVAKEASPAMTADDLDERIKRVDAMIQAGGKGEPKGRLPEIRREHSCMWAKLMEEDVALRSQILTLKRKENALLAMIRDRVAENVLETADEATDQGVLKQAEA